MSLVGDHDGKPLAGVVIEARLVLCARSRLDPPDEEGGASPGPEGGRVMLRPVGPLSDVVEQSCGVRNVTTAADGKAVFAWDPVAVQVEMDKLEPHRAGPAAAKVTGEFRLSVQIENVKKSGTLRQRVTRADETLTLTRRQLLAYTCVGHTTAQETCVWFSLIDPPVPGATYEVRLYNAPVIRPGSGARFPRVGAAPQVGAAQVALTERNGTARFTGLTAGSSYTYQVVRVGGNVTPAERVVASGSLGTLQQNPAQLRIAFASCKNVVNTRDGAAVLGELARQPRDMLFLIGDQLYGDRAREEFGWQTAKTANNAFKIYDRHYAQTWVNPGWRACIGRSPVYMMLDDHDVADDWGTTFSENSEPDLVSGALKAYRSWQHDHNPPTAKGQYHYHFSVGPVSFFFMDLRTHRGRGEDANHPLLGPVQAADLQSWASGPAANADVAVLVCPVPLALIPGAILQEILDAIRDAMERFSDFVPWPGGEVVEWAVDELGDVGPLDNFRIVEPDLADAWTVQPARRDLVFVLGTLFDLANDVSGGGRKPRAVIVLSGDSHAGAIHEISSSGAQHTKQKSIVQLLSSPLTAAPATGFNSEKARRAYTLLPPGLDMPAPYSARFTTSPPFLAANNFGMLTITRTQTVTRTYRIEGSIRSGGGSLTFDREYNLSPLAMRPGIVRPIGT